MGIDSIQGSWHTQTAANIADKAHCLQAQAVVGLTADIHLDDTHTLNMRTNVAQRRRLTDGQPGCPTRLQSNVCLSPSQLPEMQMGHKTPASMSTCM